MIDQHKEILQDLRNKSILLVKEEQASNIFLRILKDLINSERVTIYDERPTENPRNPVGFIKDDKLCIIPSLAFQEVQRVMRDNGNQLNFSINEVGRQLVAGGIITLRISFSLMISPPLSSLRTFFRTSARG